MTEQDHKAFCHNLAKAFSTGVRLYSGDALLYYYSVYHLHPDPATPYAEQILKTGHTAGVVTTPLYQFYGFITMPNGYKIILGPTCILQDNAKEMQELLFLLGINEEKKPEYERQLRSAPIIDAERFAWLLAALGTALYGRDFPVSDVWMQIRPSSSFNDVRAEYTKGQLVVGDDVQDKQTVQQSYAWEQLVTSYIEEGQPQMLRDLFSAPPSIKAGQMSQDTLRQSKNAGICAAALSARAAIKGGIDSADAFRVSDLYIQKMELLRNAPLVEKLIQEMMIDFAEHVEKTKYRTQADGRLFSLCSKYISQNIFSSIRAEEIAAELGYTRAYLCNQFKRQTGISLTQYILEEKILESKRMLRFTDKSLSEISALFGFSSQSHFQTVFKKISGETPAVYRKREKVLY